MVNGKRKGSAFEREVCVRLSLWITEGQREDVFWRSAMSGGRATVKGTKVRQAGDICAVAPEGHTLCNKFFIECKHVKKLALDQFLIKGTGPLAEFWKVACSQAKTHNKMPLLIAKQNGWPIIIVYDANARGVTTFLMSLSPFLEAPHFDINTFEALLALQPPKASK